MARKVLNGSDGNTWEKGKSGNPNGRPKSIIGIFKERLPDFVIDDEELYLSKADLSKVWESIKLMTVEQLTAAVNKKLPSFVELLIRTYIADLKKGELKNTAMIETMVYGKQQTTTAIQINNNGIADSGVVKHIGLLVYGDSISDAEYEEQQPNVA